MTVLNPSSSGVGGWVRFLGISPKKIHLFNTFPDVEILLWFCYVLKVGQRRGKGLVRWGKWLKKVGGIDEGSGVEEGGAMGWEGRIDGLGG